MYRVACLPLLVQLVLLVLAAGEVSADEDPKKIRAQQDADALLRPRVAELRRRRLEVERAERDETRREKLKNKTDADAELRPVVQAQRKAERQHKREVSEARKAAEVSVNRQTHEEESAHIEVHKEQQKEVEAQSQKEARLRVLRARWQEVLAAKRRAQEEASLPLEEQMARKERERAAVQAENERVRKQKEAKEQKAERERKYRKVQRLRSVTESKEKQRLEQKERRLAEFAAMQKAREEKKANSASQIRTLPGLGEAVDMVPDDATAVLVRDAEGNEFPVNLPNKAHFQVIFGTASHRLGVEQSKLRFTHRGVVISPSDTLMSHKLEDGDIIRVAEV